MRPIDADNFYIPKGFFNDGINVPKIYALLKMQPTLDYKDLVPQGEWIQCFEQDGGTVGYCSECHAIRFIDPFCPNCGARMQ